MGVAAALGGGGEGDGVRHSRLEILKAGFGLHGEQGGAFLVAADGTVECVKVGLKGFSYFGDDFCGVCLGIVEIVFCRSSADVGLEIVQTACQGD